jgi:hypothetical protein
VEPLTPAGVVRMTTVTSGASKDTPEVGEVGAAYPAAFGTRTGWARQIVAQ